MLRLQKFGTSLACLLLSSLSAFGSDIVGGQAPVLTANMINDASKASFARRCEQEAGLITIPNRGTCDRILKESKLSQAVYDHCYDTYREDTLGNFLSCIERGSGRDYPLSYIKACKGISSLGKKDPRICTEYLANTSSTFDAEAFKFCMESAQKKLQKGKYCLNAIRDRKIDVQGLKRTCIDERIFEQFDDCVERFTDLSPSSCSSPTQATGPSKPAPPAGQHSGAR